MQPVPPRERIAVIDVLRGAALIGIIVANMRGFDSPMEVYLQPHLVWDSPVDRLTQHFIDLFVSGKFITIFAILFGLGFAVQLTRATKRGVGLTGTYLRRMLWLALFGVAHVVFLWWGDILLAYAVVGVALLLFRNQPSERLMLWAQIFYWFPILILVAGLVMSLTGAGAMPEFPQPTPEGIERATAIYSGTDFPALFRQRLTDWAAFNSAFPIFLPRVLGIFLFGFWLWRTGVFENPVTHLPRVRRLLPWFLVVGLAGNLASVAIQIMYAPNPTELSLPATGMMLTSSVGIPALSLFYGGAILVLFQRPRIRPLLEPFSYVGRMALTNYLLQSVICTWIFYGYGLGYFGSVGPLPGFFLAIGIYAAQVVFSAGWLRTFRYGPAEWLWRSVTYARPQPMRREAV